MSRPATDVLREIRHGAMVDELTAAFQEVVAAVRDTGKIGERSLAIKVRPGNKKWPITKVEIEDKLVAKPPVLPNENTLFFADTDNNLVRTDPEQVNLNLKQVEEPDDQPLKQVAGDE